ncbi:MAG: ankyrin repeat domain-containing protein [Alphaproteobacteria bacterium]|nr:ankyrin repeat domain-containing protein [Alphaproteobacteria bacterium]
MGLDPVGLAAASGHTEVVRLLLQAGADPHIANNEGYRPIDRVPAKNTELVELLAAAMR